MFILNVHRVRATQTSELTPHISNYSNTGIKLNCQNWNKVELFQHWNKAELFQHWNKAELFQHWNKAELFQHWNKAELFQHWNKAELFQHWNKAELSIRKRPIFKTGKAE